MPGLAVRRPGGAPPRASSPRSTRRRLQRLLPPDRRHGRRDRRHPGRLRRDLRLRRRRLHQRPGPGDRRLGRGDRRRLGVPGATQITASAAGASRPGHPARRRHRAGDGVPDDDRGRARGARGRAARADRHLHRDQRLQHQPLRRDRPGHRRPSRCIQPTEVAAPGTPRVRRPWWPTTPRAPSPSTTASSIDFLPFGGGDNQDVPLPWLTPHDSIRVGAPVDARAAGRPRLPQQHLEVPAAPQQVTGDGRDVATFENTRPHAAPADVGGDLQLGTFNVLNYFHDHRRRLRGRGLGACTYYHDRDDDPVTVNSCTPNGPAARPSSATSRRQQAKIVAAINTHGRRHRVPRGDRELGQARRDRPRRRRPALVDALNAAAGADAGPSCPRRRRGLPPSPAGRHPHRASSTTRAVVNRSVRRRCSSARPAFDQRPRAAGPGLQAGRRRADATRSR